MLDAPKEWRGELSNSSKKKIKEEKDLKAAQSLNINDNSLTIRATHEEKNQMIYTRYKKHIGTSLSAVSKIAIETLYTFTRNLQKGGKIK